MIDLSALNRHTKMALSVSGGKDSLACVYLLREHLQRLTVYHVDSGDFLPETLEIVRHVEAMAPNFVRITTDVEGWIGANGIPSDLVPYSSHPIGRALDQAGSPLSSRYDCCFANVMWPLLERVRADGATLLIRGTKTSDVKRLPTKTGDVIEGVEVLHPIQDWLDEDVLAYLRSVGAPISRTYQTVMNSLDCATCSAWWSEGRAAYLRQYHPALLEKYSERLLKVHSEIRGSLGLLKAEMTIAGEA